MELRELECLVAIADTGGVSKAALALGVTQPGVSAAVRRLERDVGERLVERSGRGIRLTAAGRAALGPARATLAARAAVSEAVAGVSLLLTGELRLGHVGSGASTTLLEPLTRFHADHPGVEVSLVEDRSEALVRRVLDGELDLAWVGVAGELPGGVESRDVLDERLVAGVASGHPLADRRSVPLAEALTHPVITLPPGTGARAALDDACAASGLTARIAFECSAPDLIGQLAARSLGVAVVAEPLARALGLRVVHLTEPAARSRLVLVWARGGPSSPAARAFVSVVGGGRGADGGGAHGGRPT